MNPTPARRMVTVTPDLAHAVHDDVIVLYGTGWQVEIPADLAMTVARELLEAMDVHDFRSTPHRWRQP